MRMRRHLLVRMESLCINVALNECRISCEYVYDMLLSPGKDNK